MAVRTLWNFVIYRAKKLLKNYNVLERADNLMECDKRAPPRHPGTEAKFKVLIKKHPDIQTEVENKNAKLLDRLKFVKVSSQDSVQNDETNSRPLPQVREPQELPIFGYEEPKSISDGKCSLRQALEFISNHQNDPNTHSIASIAETYKMKASDVEQVIKNFRVFQIFISDNRKVGITKEAMKILGINKVIQPLYRKEFSEFEKEAKKIAPDDKK